MDDKRKRKKGFMSFGGFDTDYSREDDFAGEAKPAAPASFKTRKEQRQRRRRVRRYIFLGVLAAVLLGFLISRSPLFDIREIRVNDNVLFTDEQIAGASGLAEGDNIFSRRKGQIRKSIMENNPYIVSVDVDRKLPDILSLTVEENDPVLALPCGEQFLILDGHGMAVAMEDSQMMATLVTGIDVKSYVFGSAPEVSDKQTLKSILKMVNEVNKNGMYFRQVDIPNPLAIQAYVTENLSCYGDTDDIRNNLDGLKALIYDLDVREYTAGVIYVGDDGYATFSPSK